MNREKINNIDWSEDKVIKVGETVIHEGGYYKRISSKSKQPPNQNSDYIYIGERERFGVFVKKDELNDYALKSETYTKTEDNNLFVHQVGAESISGTKTFTESPIVPNPTLNQHPLTKFSAERDYINKNQKDVPNGVAVLDSNGKVLLTELPTEYLSAGIIGEVVPTTIPTSWTSGDPDLYERYDVLTAGTYTNFIDSSSSAIVVSSANLDKNWVQIWVTNGVSKLVLKSKPQASKSIPQFADLQFPVTNTATEKVQCVDNFVPYQLLDGKTSTSSDFPSTSSTIWKSIGSNSNGVTIPFSPVISFDNNLAISTKTVNSPITFTALGDYAILGGSTMVRLIADGANIPNLTNFKKWSGSGNYVNTAGVLNVIYFFYDGLDAWYSIGQGTGSSNIIYNDVTPPTPPTLSKSNETVTTVNLSWTGATDNVGVTSYEIYKDNILIDTVSASPLTVTGLTASTTYAFKVKAKDASGNKSAFSNVVSVTTSAAPPTFLSVVFDELYGATYSSGLLSGNNLTGGYQSTAQTINDGFFLYMTDFAFTSVLGLVNSKTSNVSYGIDSTYIYAFYRTNVGVDLVKGAGRTLMHSSSSGVPNYVKLERVGNNAVFSTSADGINWTVLFTDTNGFNGVTTGYIKGVFANNAGTIRAFKTP